MKKIISVLLLFVFCCASVWAQKPPFNALGASRGAVKSARAARQLERLSNARIEALVRRGKERLVIQRALSAAARENSPLVSILKAGELNRPLLTAAWKDASRTMNRWKDGNIVGLNAWMLVLGHRIKEGMKLSLRLLDALEKELLMAQEQAEAAYKLQYGHKFGAAVRAEQFDQLPEFRALLGESVAQRLSDNFLPLLSSADRVRFLKVLMQGVFSSPVNPRELNLAVLNREVQDGLHFMGPRMKRIDQYGDMKNWMREAARAAADEAAANGIESLVVLRGLFVENLESYAARFAKDSASAQDWQELIEFYRSKSRRPRR